jgi:ApeA N-terminal domain 1
VRDRTLEGYWWLAGQEDNKIPGILTYDGTEVSLRLLGAFTYDVEQSPGVSMVETTQKAPLILGAADGEAVTLVDCRQRSLSARWGMTEDRRQTFDARLMLVGIWLDQPREEYFDKILVGVDHLLAWSRQSGLELRADFDESIGHWSRSVKWDGTDEPLTAHVGDAMIELRLRCATKGVTRADRTENALVEHAALVVTLPELRSADAQIEQWTKAFQDLLTLAMDTPCGLQDITLVRTNPPVDPSETETRESERVRPVEVDVYFAPLYRAKPDAEAVHSHDALFTLNDVSFAELIPAWFDLNERLGPVIGMLLGERYLGRSFVENRLITAVAAAEGLHRRLLTDKTYLPDDQFEALTSDLIKAVPAEHVRWLTDRLWNEPSLKQRLMQLVECLGDDVVEPFMPKPNRWARRAKDARNLLVHRFDEDDSREPLTNSAMYVLAAMTSSVITLVLLQEIGLSRAQLSQLAEEQRSFQWIGQEGRRYVPWVFGEQGQATS